MVEQWSFDARVSCALAVVGNIAVPHARDTARRKRSRRPAATGSTSSGNSRSAAAAMSGSTR